MITHPKSNKEEILKYTAEEIKLLNELEKMGRETTKFIVAITLPFYILIAVVYISAVYLAITGKDWCGIDGISQRY